MFFRLIVLCALSVFAMRASASDELDLNTAPDHALRFVESNLIGAFYHEFAHALIDILDLPIYGQEETAADVFSAFAIDAFFVEESARQLVRDNALGFRREAEELEEDGVQPAYWDIYAPDTQRYFTLLCLAYGAGPNSIKELARDMGLPESRAEDCEFEYAQADHAWGGALDRIHDPEGGDSIRMRDAETDTDAGKLTLEVVTAEVDALNEEFRLPKDLWVSVKPCGEPNAFYYPDEREIVLCVEFADYMFALAPADVDDRLFRNKKW